MNHPAKNSEFRGAFVISLDFELHWGVSANVRNGSHPYWRNLKNTPLAVEQMLEVFEQYGIATTWATVGFLFASNKEERKKFDPKIKPTYANSELDTYSVNIGEDVTDDRLHYAPDLMRKIQQVPKQEIASHTYSHYFCLAEGQDEIMFRADLESAKSIAEYHNIDLKTIVFPKNQIHSGYLPILREYGIEVYRGNESGWMHPKKRKHPSERASISSIRQKMNRAGRLLDAYVPVAGDNVIDWNEVPDENGLYNVAASYFLRPWNPRLKNYDNLKLYRIKRAMKKAAKEGKIFHLWWHPHNFGRFTEENVLFFKNIAEYYQHLSDKYGMSSLTMYDVAKTLKAE